MAALDRLDELEEFMLRLQPDDTFRPNRLWRLPLLGTHDYRLPETVRERLGDTVQLARDLAAAPIELFVTATDVSVDVDGAFELLYSSRTTPPQEMADALLASAAISGLVLPLRVGDRIATDGAWVRNFPLGHAYNRSGVELIVSFRYLPTYPEASALWLARLRKRLERFGRVPPVAALLAEVREAEERAARGEPAHWGDLIVRLMRVTVQQNTIQEERWAQEKDESIGELERLRHEVGRVLRAEGGRRGDRLARAADECFAAAQFPFRHDRLIPRIAVRGTVGAASLETTSRNPEPWTEETKRALIDRGYALLDFELRELRVA
jgi:predicted acylesterase/phospholipase RssA